MSNKLNERFNALLDWLLGSEKSTDGLTEMSTDDLNAAATTGAPAPGYEAITQQLADLRLIMEKISAYVERYPEPDSAAPRSSHVIVEGPAGPALGELQAQIDGLARDLEEEKARSHRLMAQVHDVTRGPATHIRSDEVHLGELAGRYGRVTTNLLEPLAKEIAANLSAFDPLKVRQEVAIQTLRPLALPDVRDPALVEAVVAALASEAQRASVGALDDAMAPILEEMRNAQVPLALVQIPRGAPFDEETYEQAASQGANERTTACLRPAFVSLGVLLQARVATD